MSLSSWWGGLTGAQQVGGSLGALGLVSGLIGGMSSGKPKEIDPIGTSSDDPGVEWLMDRAMGDSVGKMKQFSSDMMDPNSAYNQSTLQNLKKAAADSTFQQNLINRRNMLAQGGGGYSGVMRELSEQATGRTQNNLINAYNQGLSTNTDKGIGLLNQAAQFDLAKGEAMASAYGQNITNQNNYAASQAGNFMQMGSGIASAAMLAMSDRRKKENIKKVGRAKTKNGKSVNIYSYNFKGSKKKNVGVIAQEIQKSHPNHVKKQKNGTLMVDYKGLFA